MVSKYEIRAKKDLIAEGWMVDDKRGMSRWSRNRDFWNLFDLVAVKKGEGCIRWISIKGRQGIPGKHRKEVEKFYLPENNIKEIWSRSQGKKGYWHKVIIK
jgi:hypothetical protein